MKQINLIFAFIFCASIIFAQSQNKQNNVANDLKATPTITVNSFYLSFGSVNIGEMSLEKSYTIVGTNLVDNITVTCPNGYMLTLTPGVDYNDTIIVPQTRGGANATIYVVFTPTSVAAYTGMIKHESMSATTKNLAIVGTGVDLYTPSIIVAPFMFNFGDLQINLVSPEQSYTITAQNLQDSLLIVVPDGFLISQTSGGTDFNDTLTIFPALGEINTTIYITFNPIAVQPYAGIITHQSVNATTKNVLVSGNGIDLTAPSIIVTPAFLNFNTVQITQTSAPLTYNVSAINLTEDITVTAPIGFQVSADGITFGTTATLTQMFGIVEAPVYVEFMPTALQLYSDVITNVSSGVTTNEAVTGIGTDNSVYNVIFNVTESDLVTPIENAEISFNGSLGYTDAAGIATFTGVSPNAYTYVIALVNHGTINGNLVVLNQDVTVKESLILTGIENIAANNVKISPNPSNGIFNIKVTDNSKVSVLITDISGRTVLNSNVNKQDFTIDLTNQNSGIYFITLKINNKIYNSKLIKK